MKYDDLNLLDELRRKGSISEEEYQREKEKILNGGSAFSFYNHPLWGMEESTYLTLMHLSLFSGCLLPVFGLALPILMWITNKNTNERVNKHGKNILNFMISYSIYSVVAFLFSFILIGLPFVLFLLVMPAIFIVVAALKANRGEYWEYPFAIKFII